MIEDETEITTKPFPAHLERMGEDTQTYPIPEWESVIAGMEEQQWQMMSPKKDKGKRKAQPSISCK